MPREKDRQTHAKFTLEKAPKLFNTKRSAGYALRLWSQGRFQAAFDLNGKHRVVAPDTRDPSRKFEELEVVPVEVKVMENVR